MRESRSVRVACANFASFLLRNARETRESRSVRRFFRALEFFPRRKRKEEKKRRARARWVVLRVQPALICIPPPTCAQKRTGVNTNRPSDRAAAYGIRNPASKRRSRRLVREESFSSRSGDAEDSAGVQFRGEARRKFGLDFRRARKARWEDLRDWRTATIDRCRRLFWRFASPTLRPSTDLASDITAKSGARRG